MTTTKPLSQKKKSPSRVKVVHDLYRCYIEGSEERYGSGLSNILAWRDLLEQTDGILFRVPSSSRKGEFHAVDLNDLDFPKCGCEYFFFQCLDPEGNYSTGMICKHIRRKAEEIINVRNQKGKRK